MKEFINKWAWVILTALFLVLYLGKGCTSSKISKVNKNVTHYSDTLMQTIDLLKSRIIFLENNTADKVKVRDMMERVMLDYLIYEDDLDKGKISLSEIKNKIEANDEKELD